MSSSRTVKTGTVQGRPHSAEPMDAARQFALALHHGGLLDRTWRLKCELHGQDEGLHGAVMLGLEGVEPPCADARATERQLRRIRDKREVRLLGQWRIAFDTRHHLIREPGRRPPSAACGIRLSAFDPAGKLLLDRSYQVSVAAAS
jgi:L-serine dehydratase